jgi:serine/threonine protein kinase/tetratricopeptide (TPR) repeat protein
MKCSKCQFDNPDATNFCGKCGVPLTADARMADSLTKTLATPLPVIAKDMLIAGKYRIIEEIGHGGMGVVYKAEDLKLKRGVALKFLPPHLMDSPELNERFLIEAQAAAALNHPNICIIHEVGESEEQPYIAMEYVEGETLRDRIKKGPLKPEEAVDLVVHVTSGLRVAHRKGIIHRDVKSANIMVTETGQVKVMDFGLAKLRGSSSLTKSQTTLGTVAYMSPEQARGEELDQRTDIWSLGVVLYEMLTGKLPFHGDHDQAVIYSILHHEPEPLLKARPGTAPELAQIIGQALVKKPADRYQTMEEFREDLASVAEGFRPIRAKRRLSGRKILGLDIAYFLPVVLAVVLALGIGINVGGVRDRLFGRSPSAVRAIRLAVLPIVNLTGDSEQEYLSEGLTQEMITRLGSLHPENLSVIARSSVMRYKKGDTPIDRIGQELGVDYVLEGSMRREKNRVRITAELIQVRNQTQLWADSYERELSGILVLQSEVAQNVAKALALKLLPAEQVRLASTRTVNPEAYDAYLKGSYHLQKLTPVDLDTAQRYLELALEKDPSFAPAYAGLSWIWGGRAQMGLASPLETGPKAKAAALQAVSLDDSSAEAHEALAWIKTWREWDWIGAEPEWRRTLKLNPNSAQTHALYSHFLANVGRIDEAAPHIELALKLDPFNALFHSLYASVLMYSRRYDEALAAARKALAMQPDAPVALTNLEEALSAKGMRDELLAVERERAAPDPDRLAAFEQGLAEAGYEGAHRRLADYMAAGYESSGRVMAVNIAIKYMFAGYKTRAIDWLEKAYEDRDPNQPYLGKPVWDSARDDPRFQDLCRRIGLPLDVKK